MRRWCAAGFGVWVLQAVAVAQTVPVCVDCDIPAVNKIAIPEGVAGDSFGQAMAADGLVAVVGTPGTDQGRGSAHVFTNTGFGWSRAAILDPGPLNPGDGFGSAVAIRGHEILVGAPGHDSAVFDGGAAYLFEQRPGGWTLRRTFVRHRAQPEDGFGSTVALRDSLLVIASAEADQVDGSVPGALPVCNPGGAVVYRRGPSNDLLGLGTWQEEAVFAPPPEDLAAGLGYGAAVAITRSVAGEDVLVIGAPNDRQCVILPEQFPGRTYIYTYIPKQARWFLSARLSREVEGDRFGEAVAAIAGTFAVGAPGEFSGPIGRESTTRTGAVYVYTQLGSGADGMLGGGLAGGTGLFLLPPRKLYDCFGADGEAFGAALALRTSDIMIGAPGAVFGFDGGVENRVGAAFVYGRDGLEFVAGSRLLAPFPVSDERFGAAVALGAIGGIAGAPAGAGGIAGTIPTAGVMYDFLSSFEDCDGNGINDLCDIEKEEQPDCNGNGIPDPCEIALGLAGDCNANTVPDDCEDCDNNGLADECDIAGGGNDCNGNLILDDCEDCNLNGFADECDIAGGGSADINGNGIPDECECECIDLVFVVDETGSMGGAIDNVKSALPQLVNLALARSGGDLRLGLVAFRDTVTVRHALTTDLAAVEASIEALSASGGAGFPEASDQALQEVITQDAMCVSGEGFTTTFRNDCLRLIVLVTDALPAGCDDDFDAGVDDATALAAAMNAADMGIAINAVYVPTFGVSTTLANLMSDYASITGGLFAQVSPSGDGIVEAIVDSLNTCLDCNDNMQVDFLDIQLGVSPDCNANNVPDECDIAEGTSNDIDGDGVPDEC